MTKWSRILHYYQQAWKIRNWNTEQNKTKHGGTQPGPRLRIMNCHVKQPDWRPQSLQDASSDVWTYSPDSSQPSPGCPPKSPMCPCSSRRCSAGGMSWEGLLDASLVHDRCDQMNPRGWWDRLMWRPRRQQQGWLLSTITTSDWQVLLEAPNRAENRDVRETWHEELLGPTTMLRLRGYCQFKFDSIREELHRPCRELAQLADSCGFVQCKQDRQLLGWLNLTESVIIVNSPCQMLRWNPVVLLSKTSFPVELFHRRTGCRIRHLQWTDQAGTLPDFPSHTLKHDELFS